MLKSGQLSYQVHVVETEEFRTHKTIAAASASLILQVASDMSQYLAVASKTLEEKTTSCLLQQKSKGKQIKN